MKEVFIKPAGNFESGTIEGPAVLANLENNYWNVQADSGETFRIFKWIWNSAVERNAWIKLGQKCRIYDQLPTQQIHQARQQKEEFNPEDIHTTLLSTIQVDPAMYRPIKTGTYIDGFWSRKGGIMPGTNTMVTGDPGIGKSSVMMDVLQGIKIQNPNKSVLYVSAEMSRIDMLDPDEFMKYYPNLFDKVEFVFASDYIEAESGPTFAHALKTILARGYDVVVFDSMIEVQSIFHEDLGLSSSRATEKYMLDLMKMHNNGGNSAGKYTAFLLIQQVKKDGEFVGSRRLEHMITAFLSIKWCGEQRGKKYMEFRKNRRGGVKMRLYFKLGVGVEYDVVKFEDEMKVAAIMAENKDVVDELSQAELLQMLSGANKNVEPEEEDE